MSIQYRSIQDVWRFKNRFVCLDKSEFLTVSGDFHFPLNSFQIPVTVADGKLKLQTRKWAFWNTVSSVTDESFTPSFSLLNDQVNCSNKVEKLKTFSSIKPSCLELDPSLLGTKVDISEFYKPKQLPIITYYNFFVWTLLSISQELVLPSSPWTVSPQF